MERIFTVWDLKYISHFWIRFSIYSIIKSIFFYIRCQDEIYWKRCNFASTSKEYSDIANIQLESVFLIFLWFSIVSGPPRHHVLTFLRAAAQKQTFLLRSGLAGRVGSSLRALLLLAAQNSISFLCVLGHCFHILSPEHNQLCFYFLSIFGVNVNREQNFWSSLMLIT